MWLARCVVVLSMVVACKRRAPELTAPSVDEATTFANELAKHMVPCDPSSLIKDFDTDVMIDRALAGRRVSDGEARGLRRAASDVFTKALCEGIEVVGANASYTLVRVRVIDGQPRPLLRLVGDGGLTYHELTLDKQADGVKLADILLYHTGQTLSEMVGSILDTMSSYDDALPMLEAKRKLKAGDPAGARAALRQLPEEMRKTRTVMMFDVNVALGQNDEEYLAAVERFSAQYPNDPSLDLMRIDQAFMRKDYKRGLGYIDSLDSQLGGDPYLDVQRVGMMVSLGDPAKTVAVATRATERVPQLPQAWWALLTAQLAAKQFGAALVTVERLKSKFGQQLDRAAMQADERFAELLVSPEYQATLGK